MKESRTQMNTNQNSLFIEIGSSGIANKSVRPVGVTMTAQAIRFVLQTGSTITLARLLTPEDFGLVAMVSVLVNFVAALLSTWNSVRL